MNIAHADPDAALDVFCLHTDGTAIPNGVARTLPNGKRVDIGVYEFVVLLVTNVGGTASSPIIFVPRESDSQTGPEFPLDGTNGAPDFTMSIPTGVISSTNASRQRVIRTRGRRQFLNIVASTVTAGGTARVVIYLLGIGKRANTGKLVNTDLGLVGPLA